MPATYNFECNQSAGLYKTPGAPNSRDPTVLPATKLVRSTRGKRNFKHPTTLLANQNAVMKNHKRDSTRLTPAAWGNIASMLLICCMVIGVGLSPVATGSDSKTGAAFANRLRQPVSIAWSGAALRAALQELSASRQVAILLDRRINPDQAIQFQATNEPLEEIIQKVAASRQAVAVQVDGIIYVAPAATAAKLRTVMALARQQLARLPASVRDIWLQAAPLRWNDLAAPRAILDELCKSSGVVISGLDSIPHDLWGAAELPSLSLLTRISLVLAQFDQTLQFAADGRSARLAPMPRRPTIERAYPGGRSPRELARLWSQRAPEATVRVQGNQVIVVGRVEDHERLAGEPRWPSSRSQPLDAEQIQIENLSIDQAPLESVLKTLAARLELTLEYDPDQLAAAGVRLDQLLTVQLTKKSTIDELLRAVLEPAGLSFQRHGRTVEIHAPNIKP
jgi:hypothetical protein